MRRSNQLRRVQESLLKNFPESGTPHLLHLPNQSRNFLNANNLLVCLEIKFKVLADGFLFEFFARCCIIVLIHFHISSFCCNNAGGRQLHPRRVNTRYVLSALPSNGHFERHPWPVQVCYCIIDSFRDIAMA